MAQMAPHLYCMHILYTYKVVLTGTMVYCSGRHWEESILDKTLRQRPGVQYYHMAHLHYSAVPFLCMNEHWKKTHFATRKLWGYIFFCEYCDSSSSSVYDLKEIKKTKVLLLKQNHCFNIVLVICSKENALGDFLHDLNLKHVCMIRFPAKK